MIQMNDHSNEITTHTTKLQQIVAVVGTSVLLHSNMKKSMGCCNIKGICEINVGNLHVNVIQ